MSAGNSAYSPLPQSNSDSDGSSEEELHVSQGNRIVNRASKVQNSKGEKAHNVQKSNIINYKPLDNDGDVGVALNKFQLSPDEVSILKPEGGLEIFSTSRKICFVFSLLLCVFTTVAFIWILPCNVGSCPNTSVLKNNDFTWEKNLPNLEIYGPICLVPDQKGNKNIIFLTKNHLDSEQNLSENGLRCLSGKDGSHLWKIKFNEEPIDVDCKLIDVNSDGFNDCLVSGRNILRAVNSLSGQEFWDVQDANKQEQKLYFSDFPTLIPDLDNDAVNELLLPYSLSPNGEESAENNFQNYLVIISGKSGMIINKPLQIKLCSVIQNLMIENSSILSFTCFSSTKKESFQNISLAKIYKSLKVPTRGKISVKKSEKLNQHKRDSDTAYVKGFRLTLKNQGNCPENCKVFVDIKDERETSNNVTVYSFFRKNTFGMTPITLKNRNQTGFILKFWSWHSKAEKANFLNGEDFSVKKTIFINNNNKNVTKSKKLNHTLNYSKFLDNEMFLGSEWKCQRMKRTATELHKNTIGKSLLNPENFNLRMIEEILIKIVVNDSSLSVSSVTKDEIIQICKKPQTCEPNVFQQRRSVSVAQIVKDGRDKLITYASKYVHKKEETKNESKAWQIEAKIRVLNV